MFCICCLDTGGPLVTITRSVHGDFMDVFPISDVDPLLVPVVCYACHTMLKKIHQFKLQVEKSFSLLINKAHNIEKKKFMMSNMPKDVHSIMPEIPETSADQTKQDTKMNTIKTALDIINSNCTSLQSLAVCNFETITETLLEATCDNLNLELRSFKASTENNEQPQKKAVNSTCTTTMLPVEIANKLEKEVTHFIELSPVIDNASGMYVLPTQETVNDDVNMTELSDEAVEIKEELEIEVVDEDICTKLLLPDNIDNMLLEEIGNSQIQKEIEEDSKVDVFIHDVFGTAVLPAKLKEEPDEVSNDSVATNNRESNEVINDSAIKNLEPNNISSDDSTHNNYVGDVTRTGETIYVCGSSSSEEVQVTNKKKMHESAVNKKAMDRATRARNKRRLRTSHETQTNRNEHVTQEDIERKRWKATEGSTNSNPWERKKGCHFCGDRVLNLAHQLKSCHLKKEDIKYLPIADPRTKDSGRTRQQILPFKRKPIERKVIVQKPIECIPIEWKPIERKPIELKPTERKIIELKPTERKPTERKPIERKPIELKPTERKQIKLKPIVRKQCELKPTEWKQIELKPTERKQIERNADIDYVTCKTCLGACSRKTFRQHYEVCNKNKRKSRIGYSSQYLIKHDSIPIVPARGKLIICSLPHYPDPGTQTDQLKQARRKRRFKRLNQGIARKSIL